MKMKFASRCQQGMRDENQDRTGAEVDEQKACFLVCDGVAGLPGGDYAAQLVRDTLLTQLQQNDTFTRGDRKVSANAGQRPGEQSEFFAHEHHPCRPVY